MKLFIVPAAAALLAFGAASAQTQSPERNYPPNQPQAKSKAPAQPRAKAPAAKGQATTKEKSAAQAATTSATDASGVTRMVITNGPVPDTPENRALFPPKSATGRATTPKGN